MSAMSNGPSHRPTRAQLDALPPEGAILALDLGDIRIGVALSQSRLIARTLPPIDRTPGRKATLDALQSLVTAHRVTIVIVGLPLLENGAEGEQAAKCRAFARSLARRIPPLAILHWDERHTTTAAQELLGASAHSAPRGRIDTLAAAVILQEFLDHYRS